MAGQTFDWLIAAPAWGTRCVDLFIERALPAIMCAGDGISGKLRFVVHTDEPERIEAALGKLEYWLYPVPPGKTPHESFGLAHREAIDLARHGECIAFINADMVASVEVFAAAERRFAVGKRMIMMAICTGKRC